MGCGRKLTTKLLTQHTCPFLSAKSNNKLVIRGHLLLPDNMYRKQEHSVGGQPGILAAVGSGSFVDCFHTSSRAGAAHPSCGPVAGWEDARSLRQGLFLHADLPCQLVCTCAKASSTHPPATAAGPLGAGSAWWVCWHSSRTGSGAAGRNVPHAGFCFFLLHFQGMQFTH